MSEKEPITFYIVIIDLRDLLVFLFISGVQSKKIRNSVKECTVYARPKMCLYLLFDNACCGLFQSAAISVHSVATLGFL